MKEKQKMQKIGLILFSFVVAVLFVSVGVSQFKERQVRGIETFQLPKASELLTPFPVISAPTPTVYAESYILVDAATNYTLLQKNAQARRPVASTTKMMTAVIVQETFPLEKVLEIPSVATAVSGSDVQLRSGERMSVEHLLYALLVKSGNDSALTFSENFPGGTTKFVEQMNLKAKALGLSATEFKDPAGLDDTGYSTAYDLSQIAKIFLKNGVLGRIVKTSSFTAVSADGNTGHELKTSNRLVDPTESYFLPQALGIKTGYTPEAGHALVSAAEKDGHVLIAVVLHTTEDTNVASAKESKKLLTWGLENIVWK